MDFIKDSNFQETFSNLSLSNETVKSKEFEECEFVGCSFINCKFQKCKFIDCKFNDCVISAINPVDCWITDITFSKCKAIGCDWTKASHIQGLIFTDCQINYSNFAMLKLPKIKLINCEAKEVDFSETDLSGGTFTGTDFERSVFSKTNLSKADFRGAVNYTIDPRYNTLKKTHFSVPEALSLLSCLDIVID
ncbi:MAG: pentapeptide repeat-containing protein [Dehalococcoidia bacterium]|nr:pentapeptide repeat-containing protein [Dehalococcoidia bacterium]MDD5494066.1 pentapeptide repeat-containing protein [Dehalococcoidia bacterium]